MANSISIHHIVSRNIIIDLCAFLVVYLVPTVVHFTGIPVYMIEPMRVMLILAMMHGTRLNSLMLAGTLPLFSWFISGHPEMVKMLIITGELLINVFLFFYLVKKNLNPWIAMLLGIFLSKVLCYLAYWPLISFTFMTQEAQPVFLLVQVITTLIFSFYCMIVYKTNKP